MERIILSGKPVPDPGPLIPDSVRQVHESFLSFFETNHEKTGKLYTPCLILPFAGPLMIRLRSSEKPAIFSRAILMHTLTAVEKLLQNFSFRNETWPPYRPREECERLLIISFCAESL